MRLLNPRRAALAALVAAAVLHALPASAATLSVQGSATFAAELPQDHQAEIEAARTVADRVVGG